MIVRMLKKKSTLFLASISTPDVFFSDTHKAEASTASDVHDAQRGAGGDKLPSAAASVTDQQALCVTIR